MAHLPSPLLIIKQTFIDWWDELVSVAAVSLLWVVCCLTIVLGPPATFGLFHVANRLAHGESVGPAGLIDAARRYFAKSWLWMLLNVIVAILVAGNLAFYAQLDGPLADILQLAFLVMLVAWLVVQFYTLPYIMEMEPEHRKLRLAMRNAALTVVSAPGYTLLIALVGLGIAALSVLLMIPLFVGGPWLVALLANRALSAWLETYRAIKRETKPPDEGAENDQLTG